MMALSLALVGETIPKSQTGSAMGLLGTMSSVGTALGPSLGGVLIAKLGWEAVFFVNVPLGAVAFVLAQRALPDHPVQARAHREGFDVAGTSLLALTLAAYALAMTLGRGRLGPTNVALLIAAAVGAAVFFRVEARVPSPLAPPEALRDRGLRASLLLSALVSTLMMGMFVVGPFYLSGALELDPARVGLVSSVGPIVAAATGVPAGRVADRLGPLRLTRIGLAIMLLALAILSVTSGVLGYAIPIALLTFGYALFQTANNTAVMMQVAPERRGVVSGMLNLARNLGLVTGASAMGAVYAWASAARDTTLARPEAVTSGFRATVAVAALLVVVALFVAMRRARTRA